MLRRLGPPADDTAIGRDPALAVRQLVRLLTEHVLSAAPPGAPRAPGDPPALDRTPSGDR